MRRASRQRDRDGCADIHGAGSHDRSAMEFHQLLHERESDAGPFVRARTRIGNPMEPLEYMRKLLWCDANARVMHRQHYAPVLGEHAHHNLSFESVLERIGEQIEDDLLPHVTIHIYRLE